MATKITWQVDPSVLLMPNVPKPLHTVAPRNTLGDVWWRATKGEAYRSTAYHCKACGVWKHRAKSRQWLEAHEVYDIDYSACTMTYLHTIGLCHFCHNYIHSGRMLSLLQQGKLHQSKYVAIIQHGDKVLKDAGLLTTKQRLNQSALDCKCNWGDWRLILFGKKYGPAFKTYEEWATFHGVS